jgi:hypothetical protein
MRRFWSGKPPLTSIFFTINEKPDPFEPHLPYADAVPPTSLVADQSSAAAFKE